MTASRRSTYVVPGVLLVLALLLEAAAFASGRPWLSAAALVVAAFGLLAAIVLAARASRPTEAAATVPEDGEGTLAVEPPEPVRQVVVEPHRESGTSGEDVPGELDGRAEPAQAAPPEFAADERSDADEPAQAGGAAVAGPEEPTSAPLAWWAVQDGAVSAKPGEATGSTIPTPAATPVPVAKHEPLLPAGPYPLLAAPQSLEPEAVMHGLFESCAQAGNPVATHLWLLDPPSATLRLVAAAGPFAPPAVPVPVSDSSLGLAVSRGSATVTPSPDTPPSGIPERTRFAVPVNTGTARGVAAADFYDKEPPDLEVLIAVFGTANAVLAGTLALFVANDDRHRARLLAEATRELSAAKDEKTIVQRTLDHAMHLSGGATGSLMLVDPTTGRMHIAASRGLPGDVVDSTDVAEGDGIAGWVLTTRKPMLVEDQPAANTAGIPARHGVRSSLSVPLLDDDEALGVLNVGTRAYPARFTDEHTETLEALATQCAVALGHVRKQSDSERVYLDTLRALVKLLEARDPFGQGDSDRVSRIAEALGATMGMDERQRKTLRIAALLHDVGMDAAGEGVMADDRPLSVAQRGLVQMHPTLGADFLSEIPGLADAGPIVAHHHERFDGTGYGTGLSGESIPVGARVLAVADAFTAMTSDRPHRQAMTVADAMAEIERNAGTQFDPRVVDAFCDLAVREPRLLAS